MKNGNIIFIKNLEQWTLEIIQQWESDFIKKKVILYNMECEQEKRVLAIRFFKNTLFNYEVGFIKLYFIYYFYS
ncbi:hypothetical protein AN964_13400 [Heyndrickxia shackletonii]|uniref:Uncharacterized protein n=1 Tax=Heyndrickxia shackletonii TaxID=157838 RepID=A0A0Q3WZ44_9BACI|nr:hypothetical protein AN964_13400 [Heyndrickxia shackletonii]